jgi:TonB family protein
MRYVCCILFATMIVGACVASDSDQREGSEMLAKAATTQNLRSHDAKPFRLHVRVHAQTVVATPTDGTYDEIWLSSDKWRREIAFPGFDQVEVGDADSKWLSRNLDFQPRVVSLMEQAVLMGLSLLPLETVGEVHNKKKDGTAFRCVRLQFPHSLSREMCLNPSGALASVEAGDRRFEYGEYTKFGDKIFPKAIHVFEKGKNLLNINVEDPVAVTDPDPKEFKHPAGALQFANCERSQGELIKKVPPHYPQEARSNHVQGTVVLYVLLSGEGRVQNTRVLESAGDSLDRATIEAVQQWEYTPANCGKAPLPTETEVQVNFALSF